MNKLNELYSYLISDNILDYEDKIFEMIPELKYEKGFDQKNIWHAYDVWMHTINVINACDKNKEDRLILLLHDIGKPFSYQDDETKRHFNNHALVSSKMAYEILKHFSLSQDKINEMVLLIKMHATRININDITKDNVNFYLRLLKLQKCDAMGYEKEHSLLALSILNQQLDKINNIKF